MPSGGRAEIENPKVYNFFTFSISALPPEGVFELNVFNLWTILLLLLKKKSAQFFERWLIDKIIKQNVQRVFIICSYPASILKVVLHRWGNFLLSAGIIKADRILINLSSVIWTNGRGIR